MRKKSKITRDRNRDVSEKVALGMASAGAGRGEEIMYDQRLFNQEKGMDSGFATDDQYNVYDQGLFTAQPMLSTLYRPKKDVDAEIPRCADGPLEFENVAEEDDIFQLDQFMTEVNKGAEELETELMKMVKQDNQWQLSARVEQLGQELAELKQALADKRVE